MIKSLTIKLAFGFCLCLIACSTWTLAKETKVPFSAIGANLQWVGVAVEEPEYTIWGASPIWGDDDKVHLFVARWPENNVDPAWRKSSEIAHYIADQPEGPFQFQEVVIKGTGKKGDWNRYAPHNPEIKKFGDTYALLYIANSDYHQSCQWASLAETGCYQWQVLVSCDERFPTSRSWWSRMVLGAWR